MQRFELTPEQRERWKRGAAEAMARLNARLADPEVRRREEELTKKGTMPARAGTIWVCCACGKTSRTKYGFDSKQSRIDENGYGYASYGWDESCMMNSVLVYTHTIEYDERGRIIRADPVKE